MNMGSIGHPEHTELSRMFDNETIQAASIDIQYSPILLSCNIRLQKKALHIHVIIR